MAVPVRKILVPESKYSIKCPYSMTMDSITVHNTANDAPALNEANYMKNNNNEVSFHAVVDDKEIIECIPEYRNAWHAGDGNGNGNRKSYSIEICYSKSGGERFEKAERNAAEYIASILKRKGWEIDRVKKHQDWSGKYCPHRTLDLGWNRFLNMVKGYLNGSSNGEGVNTVRRLSPGSAHLYCNAPIRDKNGKVIINAKKDDHITILDHGTAGVKVRHNSTEGFMDCKYVMPDIKKGDKLKLVEDVTVTIKKGTELISCDSGYLGNIVNGNFIVSSKSFEKIE